MGASAQPVGNMDLKDMFDEKELERIAKMQADISKCVSSFEAIGNVFGFLGTIGLCIGCSFLSVLLALSNFVIGATQMFLLPSVLGFVLFLLCNALKHLAFPMICQARCERIAGKARKGGKEKGK